MTDERKNTGSAFRGRFIARMIDAMMNRCAEKMMPRMQAMCAAAVDEQEANGSAEPRCTGCG